MDLKLKVLLGKNAGQLLPVTGRKFFIGRAEDCQLRPKSDLVSRHHCALMVDDDFAAVRDFGSRNGTFVNGERVVGERELKSGDRLVIGALEFEVVLTASAEVTKRPRVHSIKEAAARTVAGPLQPAGDASQWLDDGDSSGGETIADTAAFSTAQTEQIRVAPLSQPVTSAPRPPEPIPAAPGAPMTDTVHMAASANDTVVGTAPVAAPQPAAPAVAASEPAPVAQPASAPQPAPVPQQSVSPVASAPESAASAPQASAAPAPSAPPSAEATRRVEPPRPAAPPPNYYVPPAPEAAEPSETEAEPTAEPVKGKKGKSGPGKLPPVSRLRGEDSREAAADTLRKFFQRR
ncbi:MAG: FHA domain-containing protein [Pirellulales bacterium]